MARIPTSRGSRKKGKGKAGKRSSISETKAAQGPGKRKTRLQSKKESESSGSEESSSSRPRKPKLVKKSEYQVEYILYADVASGRGRSMKDRHWQYKVKWVGYPDSENTWETEASFKGDIVEDFWKDIEQSAYGESEEPQEEIVRDARKHSIGTRYTPSAQWIKRQKLEAAQAAKAAASG